VGSRLTLILGGARSGKSTYAEQLAQAAAASGQAVLYVATAAALDEEMAQRIHAHQARRPASWETLEATREVGAAIARRAPQGFVLLDCLTLLASNVLLALPETAGQDAYQAALDAEVEALLAAFAAAPGEWVIVSNEVGLGLVPPYPLGRLYRDGLGRANQRLAQAAGRVLFMVAGLPMTVKG
jgi:adenosylcobinamide kinase/adenosylcobinamide-phosphate guanylyltransferase